MPRRCAHFDSIRIWRAGRRRPDARRACDFTGRAYFLGKLMMMLPVFAHRRMGEMTP